MKKKCVRLGIAGLLCVLLTVMAVWYSLANNDGNLVYPADLSVYVPGVKDLPVIIAVFIDMIYVLVLFFCLFAFILRENKKSRTSTKTRELNPRLGWLGLLGFLGFAGFWTYSYDKTIFPFCFFGFWGFFGFFYEGKMSGTFMDERFLEDAKRAQLWSLKTGFSIIILTLIICGQGRFLGNLEYTAIIYTIVISATLGLVMFLSEYLLYRYDRDGMNEE